MTFSTSREISAPTEDVFAAFTDTKRLARWWGPAGFTNKFEVCEFTKGGRWVYTMYGPNGKDYPQESKFEEIEHAQKVVIQHISLPRYRLTITLESSGANTVVSWSQEFENPTVAKAIEHIVVPGNEENLHRLTAEVLGR